MFYEGTEPGLDPQGLFDYSKGRWSAITSAADVQKWYNGSLQNAVISGTSDASGFTPSGNTRKVIIKMCGFADTGAGKLIGPDGNEMDTEDFLSSMIVYTGAGLSVASNSPCAVSTGPLLFRVVTQQYGKGMVQYGSTTSTTWPSTGVS